MNDGGIKLGFVGGVWNKNGKYCVFNDVQFACGKGGISGKGGLD
jgi:hypothetical protein